MRRHHDHEHSHGFTAGPAWQVGRAFHAPPPRTRNPRPSLLARFLRWLAGPNF